MPRISNMSGDWPAILVLGLLLSTFGLSCGGGSQSSTGGGTRGANSWEPINSPPGATSMTEVVQNKAGHLFATDAHQGFFRSNDGGSTWTGINNGIATISANSIFVVPATQTLIASTLPLGGGTVAYWRSTDEGNSWSRIGGGYQFHNNGWPATVAHDGSILFGGWWTPFPQAAMWRSTDDGNSAVGASTSPLQLSTFGYGVNPVNGDVWMGTENHGIYRSRDNGQSFTSTFTDPTLTGDNRAFAFNSSGQILTIGTNSDLLIRSTDNTGTKWTTIMNVHVQARALIQDANFVLYQSRDDVGVMRSTDGGDNWENWNGGLPAGIHILHLDIGQADGRIYAGVEGGTAYRTVNPVQ
jgi:photosystem II stability/assembly factor-like uncharacterized protein